MTTSQRAVRLSSSPDFNKSKKKESGKCRHFMLLFFVLLSAFTQAQFKEKDIVRLREDLNVKLNQLRQSGDQKSFIPAESLVAAAQWHSEYMAREGKLEHGEKKASHRTAEKRVKFFKGEFGELIEEQLIEVTWPNKRPKKSELAAISDQIIQSLHASKNDYANLLESEFQFSGVGVQYSIKTQKIYVTHVMASISFDVPGQLSKNAFGVREGREDCNWGNLENFVANLGNCIEVVGDSIILAHHDINRLKAIISGSQDGVVIDLIHRDQVLCGRANQLDGSPIYDGILLKPIYRDEFFKGNRAEGAHHFIGKIGTIPEGIEFKSDEWSVSLILLKNNARCSYITPVYSPAANYEMVPLDPIMVDVPELPFKKRGVVRTQTVHYNFEHAEGQAATFPIIDKIKGEIYKVDIQAYSSIDGDSLRNVALFQSRASAIRSHIRQEIGVPEAKFHLAGKENWEEMNFQLNMLSKESWLDIPRDSLRHFSHTMKDSLKWDSLFYLQRQATADIHYWDKFTAGQYPGETVASINLRTGVILQDESLVNKALFAMFQEKEFNHAVLFEPAIVRFVSAHPRCVGNYAGLLSTTSIVYTEELTRFIHHWVQRPEELSQEAHYNLSILHTLVSAFYLDRWDVHSARLANVVHPKKFEVLLPDSVSNDLLLNLRISNINYYGQINDYRELSKVFNELHAYFESKLSSEEDRLQLARFFNYWSSYKLTVNLFMPGFRNGNLSEEELLMLMMTMCRSGALRESGEYLVVHQECAKRSKEDWCAYVNQHFQFFRDYRIKNLFCETCE
jgi:uncharacterized protein YkwD